MDKQNIIKIILEEKPYLAKEFGVEEIALFGSYAKDSQSNDSDIDLLVSSQKPSYSILMGLYMYLEKKT